MGEDRRWSRPQAGQSLTEYRRYALHGVLLVLALAAFVAIGRSVKEVTGPVISAASHESVSQSGAGYIRPLVVLDTLPGRLVRDGHVMEAAATPTPGPEATPPPSPEPTPAPQPERQPAFVTYRIQPGDTVSSIAASFGIDQSYITWNNPEIRDPDLLLVGENLLVPSVNGIRYEVRLGDTLTDIASYYQIDAQSIQAFGANGIGSADAIKEGMVLLLPGAVPPPPPIPAAVAAVVATAPEPAAAPPAPRPQPPSSTGYIWPWYGGVTTYFSGGHPAIDIDGWGNYGAAVVAAADGQVVLVAWDTWAYGYHVIIQHADGSTTLYAHLSNIYVSQGQSVAQGEAVGALGCTGYCTGTHLHFGLSIGGVPVDPLAYLP